MLIEAENKRLRAMKGWRRWPERMNNFRKDVKSGKIKQKNRHPSFAIK